MDHLDGVPCVADPDDLLGDSWVALWRSVLDAGGIVDGVQSTSTAALRAVVGQTLEQARRDACVVFGVRETGQLQGVLVMYPGPGPLIRHRFEVRFLMVDPASRRRGYAKGLLAMAAETARAQGRVHAQALVPDTVEAEAFFIAQGWVRVGRRRSTLKVGPCEYRDELMYQLESDGVQPMP